MKYKNENFRNKKCTDNFICINCGSLIYPSEVGTEHRNHCPHCLHSKHVDVLRGDRAEICHGSMKPISIWVKENGEWAIIHQCQKCGKMSNNRTAPDDSEEKLISLATRPMTMLPFPIEEISLGGKKNAKWIIRK